MARKLTADVTNFCDPSSRTFCEFRTERERERKGEGDNLISRQRDASIAMSLLRRFKADSSLLFINQTQSVSDKEIPTLFTYRIPTSRAYERSPNVAAGLCGKGALKRCFIKKKTEKKGKRKVEKKCEA